MKIPAPTLVLFLLPAIFTLPGCLSESEGDPLEALLQAEARRFEKAPETVGFDYLDDAYAQLSLLHEFNRLWALEELTSDEAAQAAAGLDWDDGGVWKELSLHTWGPGHQSVGEAWMALISGLATVYNAQQVFARAERTSETDAIIAEAECLRNAFNYYFISLFGQVPARDEADEPVAYRREEAFGLAIAALTGILEELPEKTRFGDERALFRMNKSAAKALLARLYLNQREFTGSGAGESEALQAVIRLCGEVINSGLYGLEPDYWDNFRADNGMRISPANELILTAWNRPDGGFTNSFIINALHGAHFGNAGSWNGFCTLAEFYNKWDQQDPRFRGPRIGEANAFFGFNVGYQFDASGDTLRLPGGSPLQYTPDISPGGTNPAAGVRPVKYEPDGILSNPFRGSENYYAIIRLAEVYLMKAEAEYRLGQETAALATLNLLRESRGAAPLLSITEDALLNEYGYEFWWEGQRRSHLIRFGRFSDPISIRPTESGPYRRLFPIPQEALDANPLLEQNPGY